MMEIVLQTYSRCTNYVHLLFLMKPYFYALVKPLLKP